MLRRLINCRIIIIIIIIIKSDVIIGIYLSIANNRQTFKNYHSKKLELDENIIKFDIVM